MKKMIFFSILLLATAMIYVYKQSGQNEMSDKLTKQAIPDDFKGINKPDIYESNEYSEYITIKEATVHRPGILLIITNDKSKAAGSNSFLRNLLFANSGQTGC